MLQGLQYTCVVCLQSGDRSRMHHHLTYDVRVHQHCRETCARCKGPKGSRKFLFCLRCKQALDGRGFSHGPLPLNVFTDMGGSRSTAHSLVTGQPHALRIR